MIASPSAYDPVQNPTHARAAPRPGAAATCSTRSMITPAEYQQALQRGAARRADEITPPQPDSTQPYFSSWLTQQLVDRYGAGRVFGGGLKIKTTLDPGSSAAAEQAIARPARAASGPSASLVAIDNKTGEVKAMVGGTDFDAARRSTSPPTATASRARRSSRSPSSRRSSDGHRARTSLLTSQPKVVHGARLASTRSSWCTTSRTTTPASTSLAQRDWRTPTTRSSPSVGLQGRAPSKIARLARADGHPHAGLHQPGDDARRPEGGRHPARDGLRLLDDRQQGQARVGHARRPTTTARWLSTKVQAAAASTTRTRRSTQARVLRRRSARRRRSCCTAWSTSGTGTRRTDRRVRGRQDRHDRELRRRLVRRASTTSYTVAVWVGYPDKLKSMKTEYHGSPVAGGTFPAEIWHDFMTAWIGIRDQRDPTAAGSPTARHATDARRRSRAPTRRHRAPAPRRQSTTPATGDRRRRPGRRQPGSPGAGAAPQQAPRPDAAGTPAAEPGRRRRRHRAAAAGTGGGARRRRAG